MVLSVVNLAITDAQLITLKNATCAKINSEYHKAKEAFVATCKQSKSKLQMTARLIVTSVSSQESEH